MPATPSSLILLYFSSPYHLLPPAKKFLPHLKIEIKRGSPRFKRFTGNMMEGKEEGMELDLPREHTLTDSVSLNCCWSLASTTLGYFVQAEWIFLFCFLLCAGINRHRCKHIGVVSTRKETLILPRRGSRSN